MALLANALEPTWPHANVVYSMCDIMFSREAHGRTLPLGEIRLRIDPLRKLSNVAFGKDHTKDLVLHAAVRLMI